MNRRMLKWMCTWRRIEGGGPSLHQTQGICISIEKNYSALLSVIYNLPSWEVAPVESDSLEDTLLTVHGCPVTYTRSLPTFLFTQAESSGSFCGVGTRCVACEILVSWPGIEPYLLHWKNSVLTNGPPGKSSRAIFKIFFLFCASWNPLLACFPSCTSIYFRLFLDHPWLPLFQLSLGDLKLAPDSCCDGD